MKIGLLKEEKVPSDKRVVLTPSQCRKLLDRYPSVNLVVKKSDVRCFSDDMYLAEGVDIQDSLEDCDVLLGVKEVPLSCLLANKTYLFFSHTIKGQEYNRALLCKMIDLGITMIDYEVLKTKEGKRLLGFGRFAGIVGAYNGLLAYGLKTRRYTLKPANQCIDRFEMEEELNKLSLENEKIIVTGGGRVGIGIIEILKKANIRQVSKLEFMNNDFNEPVFVHLESIDYNIRKDNNKSVKKDFYKNPHLYKSNFMSFAKYADIFIAGHFYAKGSPFLFTREDIKHKNFNIKVVADISCDIDGPVASTIRSSTINDPIYGYNPISEMEDDFMKDNVIAVMAVDNLPCELPNDASFDFGDDLLEKIIPLIVTGDKDQVLENATICKGGDLTVKFEYLRSFINKN